MNCMTIIFTDLAGAGVASASTAIGSIEQLRTIMTHLRRKEPRVVNLESVAKDILQLGVGGQFGFGQFLKQNRLPPYFCAKAQKMISNKHVEFLCGGTPTPIPPELCISFEDAVKIGEYFFATGARDPDFEWVEV